MKPMFDRMRCYTTYRIILLTAQDLRQTRSLCAGVCSLLWLFSNIRRLQCVAFTSIMAVATIPRQFWDFLKIVDGDVERSDVFLRTCAGAFLANSAADEFDLIGFDVVDAKRGGPICG